MRFFLITATVFLTLATGIAKAAVPPSVQPKSAATSPKRSEPSHALTARDLKTFFAGLVPYALHRNDIAGGVISVVKNGHIIFAKGYGYANLAKHTPVVADRTLFRPGSVSKLFTWTAVMQLVGAGKINLNQNINTYLDFKIPPKYGNPITMHDLMTHTPGFEEVIKDLLVKKPKQLEPLRRYLVKHMPERIYPPGKIVAYSNYGAALAGYIVQRVSGQPFDVYIANHIFKPLNMTHSTFQQPLPKSLKPMMAKGYRRASKNKSVPFELVSPFPAGSLSATATDVAHFMIAQLQNGRFRGNRILKPRIVKLMHSPQYKAAPGMNGFDLGFYQENRNGHRIIGHAGDTNVFHSDLHLITDADVGIFMSFNSSGRNGAVGKLRVALFRNFLDRYFPYSPPHQKTVANPKTDAKRVAGWYKSTRREESALRLLFLLGQNHVTALEDGTIKVSMLKDQRGSPLHWHEVGPLEYREVGGQTHLKFVADNQERIRYWISDDFPPVELFQRVRGFERLDFLKPTTAAFVIILVLTLCIWFGGWLVRRHFHRSLNLTPAQYWLRLGSRIGVLIQLAVLAGWLASLIILSTQSGLSSGWLLSLYVLGALAILGGIIIVVEAILRVARGPGRALVRIGEAALALSAIYGIWAVLDFGLANFHMSF